MKKNLISVIILALVFANFVLTALLVFTILPETKKANSMIEAVCSAIDLDLNSGAATGVSNVPLDQIVDYKLHAGEQTTMNFAASEDGSSHYLVVTMSLSLNKESDGFAKYGADLSGQESIISDDIQRIVRCYTMEKYNENPSALQDEILEDLQGRFGKDFIVSINFISPLTQ